MTRDSAILIAALAVVTAAIKALGPVAFGGRPLPRPLEAIVGMLAPALLSALVVTQALADGTAIALGPETVGVTAGGLAAWWRAPALVSVLIAAGLTAALRAV